MEVATDREDRTAHDAIRQILSARDVHKIAKTFDVKLVITKGELRLLDSEGVGTKAAFSLDDLALWTSDPTNKKLLAFVVRTKGGKADGRHKFTSYVFECADENMAEEICHKFMDATKLAFEAMMVEKKTPVVNQEENTVEVHQAPPEQLPPENTAVEVPKEIDQP